MMDWHRLLSRRRLAKPETPPENPYRSAFEVDIDRITFSTSFRRLADKQQVHGIGGSDYVRSRLTHSMEAARVGRSLGTMAGQGIIDRYGTAAVPATPFDIGHVVAAAALAHDLGTPCFAHTGEDIVSDWFETAPLGQQLLAGLPDPVRLELTRFEGNAQGFRVISRLQGWRSQGGLQLTLATLGAYAKYPWAAGAGEGATGGAGPPTPHARKYGYFQSEADLFGEVAAGLALIPTGPRTWCRHPLAWLVEAADDACYRIVDVEDAVKMGLLTFEEAEELLSPVVTFDSDYAAIEDEDRKLIYLRARAIDRLVGEAAAVFLDRLAGMMGGEPGPSLLTQVPSAEALAEIDMVSASRIYRAQQRCETDLVAARTITALLDAYGEALLAREKAGPGADLARRHSALLETLPGLATLPWDREGWVRALLDFLAGMTDRFAIRQAQLIAG